MKKIALAVMAAMSLTACDPGGIATAPPAPLQQTTIDEKGLIAALQAFDVTLTAIDGLVATGYLAPGSATALKVQGYINTARKGFNTAVAAQKAGSVTDYVTALSEAQKALTGLSATLKGN
jgi:hypothetical protein